MSYIHFGLLPAFSSNDKGVSQTVLTLVNTHKEHLVVI